MRCARRVECRVSRRRGEACRGGRCSSLPGLIGLSDKMPRDSEKRVVGVFLTRLAWIVQGKQGKETASRRGKRVEHDGVRGRGKIGRRAGFQHIVHCQIANTGKRGSDEKENRRKERNNWKERPEDSRGSVKNQNEKRTCGSHVNPLVFWKRAERNNAKQARKTGGKLQQGERGQKRRGKWDGMGWA